MSFLPFHFIHSHPDSVFFFVPHSKYTNIVYNVIPAEFWSEFHERSADHPADALTPYTKKFQNFVSILQQMGRVAAEDSEFTWLGYIMKAMQTYGKGWTKEIEDQRMAQAQLRKKKVESKKDKKGKPEPLEEEKKPTTRIRLNSLKVRNIQLYPILQVSYFLFHLRSSI